MLLLWTLKSYSACYKTHHMFSYLWSAREICSIRIGLLPLENRFLGLYISYKWWVLIPEKTEFLCLKEYSQLRIKNHRSAICLKSEEYEHLTVFQLKSTASAGAGIHMSQLSYKVQIHTRMGPGNTGWYVHLTCLLKEHFLSYLQTLVKLAERAGSFYADSGWYVCKNWK